MRPNRPNSEPVPYSDQETECSLVRQNEALRRRLRKYDVPCCMVYSADSGPVTNEDDVPVVVITHQYGDVFINISRKWDETRSGGQGATDRLSLWTNTTDGAGTDHTSPGWEPGQSLIYGGSGGESQENLLPCWWLGRSSTVTGELTDVQADVLIDVLLDSPDMDVFLRRLVDICRQELGQALGEVHCSVTVVRERKAATVCSSDAETAVFDELQYSSKEGPCMEAARTGQDVEVVDLHTEERWPRYVRAMAGKPVRSVLAVPIALKSAGGAALNFYSTLPGPIPEQAKRALVEFTTVAANAVSLSVRLQTQKEKSEDLVAALESRTAIDLAAGVIMAQTGCPQAQAMKILLDASSHRNEKLRDVALSILERFNGGAVTHFQSPA
jgi:hypothetical protein